MLNTAPALTFADFRSLNEILIQPHASDAQVHAVDSTFTVYWIDGPGIRQQTRTGAIQTYIHRVTRSSKRPHRLI